MTEQFHFDPTTYLAMVEAEVPAYHRLQDAIAQQTSGLHADRILDLGTGTGITMQRIIALHPHAQCVGIDESPAMLEHARRALPHADLRVARLEDEFPSGPFDVVISALAVHHLDGPGKAHLFRRVARALTPTGRFVLGDVVVPEDAADTRTPVHDQYDRPSSIAEQLQWLREAGFLADTAWREGDLAVLVGTLQPHSVGRRGPSTTP